MDGVANYVIGSPSVEMYMKAFNVYKDNNPNSTTLINKIENANGYSVGANNSYLIDSGHTTLNLIEAGPNNIFMTAGSDNYSWLASPESYTEGSMLYVNSNGTHVGTCAYSNTFGVCPVVSISN